MRNLKVLATIMMFAIFSVLLFGCKNIADIDLQNIESITINFELNNGDSKRTIIVDQELISSIDVEALKDIKLEDLDYLLPEKKDFLLENWYFDEAFTQPLEEDSVIIDEYLKILKLESIIIEITIYAKWIPLDEKIYTITYNLDGGSNNSLNPISFSEADQVDLLEPSKKGFVFLGWFDNSDFVNDKILKIPLGTKINVMLYASWKENNVDEIYNITYHLDGGENEAENVVIYKSSDKNIILLSPIKEGFSFMGWYSDSEFTTIITTIPKGSTGDIDLWAKWGDASMLTFAYENGSYYVKRCLEDYSGVVEVPTTYNGLKVVGIGEAAFYLCENVTEVILSDNITYIGSGAFENCRGLRNIDIHDNITSIGSSAFESCNSFTDVTIGDGVTIIEMFTFNGCENLTTFTLGKNITRIERQSFSFNRLLTSITLNDKLTYIGESAFSYSDVLETITIPKNVEYIDQFTFSHCDNLTIYCEAESEPADWHSKWNSNNCPVEWGVGGTPTSYNIFYNLNGGTNHIDNLSSFSGDTDVVLKNPEKEGYTFLGWYIGSDFLILVPLIPAGVDVDVILFALWEEGTSPSYLTYMEYDDYVVITGMTEDHSEISIPESYNAKPVTTIAVNAFYHNQTLTTVHLPETITTIEKGAFSICTNLSTINFPSSLKTIGESAFAYCGFTSLVLPETIDSYGADVFSNNEVLVNLELPDTMTVISPYMFQECELLKVVNIPSSIIEIQEGAFSNCLLLQNVNLLNVAVIGSTAFANCQAMTSIVLSDELTVLADHAFAYARLVTSITLPKKLQTIGEGTFNGLWDLTEIELPEKLETVGRSAFYDCGLTVLNLPASVRSIGKEAFKYNDFTHIYLPETLEIVKENAFSNLDKLQTVYISSSILALEANIFRSTGNSVKIYIDSPGTPSTWDTGWSDYFTGEIKYNFVFE